MKNKLYRNIAITCVLSLAASAGALAQGYPTSKTTQDTSTTSSSGDDTHDSPLSRMARASSSKKGGLSGADQTFARNAARGGTMEVEMGRKAESHGASADVKRFGARMVADHGKANAELKSILAAKGMNLPDEKNSGKWVSDKEYVNTMVADHEKDLAEFQKEAQSGNDPDLRRFAEKTSAVIQNHLAMAKELQTKIK